MINPVSVNRAATPSPTQQQIDLLRTHLSILEHLGADPKVIDLVKQALMDAEERLGRELKRA
jgi:hypothetical protein